MFFFFSFPAYRVLAGISKRSYGDCGHSQEEEEDTELKRNERIKRTIWSLTSQKIIWFKNEPVDTADFTGKLVNSWSRLNHLWCLISTFVHQNVFWYCSDMKRQKYEYLILSDQDCGGVRASTMTLNRAEDKPSTLLVWGRLGKFVDLMDWWFPSQPVLSGAHFWGHTLTLDKKACLPVSTQLHCAFEWTLGGFF